MKEIKLGELDVVPEVGDFVFIETTNPGSFDKTRYKYVAVPGDTKQNGRCNCDLAENHRFEECRKIPCGGGICWRLER